VEHDDDDEDLNIHHQAAECLSLFASCTKDLVVPQTIEFISSNLLVSSMEQYQTLTWNQKEAAIIAFGSIIEGPCKFKTIPLVNQVISNGSFNYAVADICLFRFFLYSYQI
jgi:importin subunit beta-1